MRRIGRQYRGGGVGVTVRSEDKKFGVGQNPIEQERTIDIIKPTDKASTDRLLEMINQMYPTAAPHQQQALDFWRVQLAQGNMTDQVKYEFLQRFHMWLLGRGNEVDTSKTMWGRGNAAVHNPQVAAYIDQFAKKRLEYALLLSLLQNRVPETLNGYYLYFKYIVNGNLKLATAADGTSFYDLSHEDFLADFDMMVQEFEKGRPGYAEIIKPAMQRPANVKAFGGEGATPSDPYPAAWQSRTTHELDSKANDEKAAQTIANRYGINAPAQSGKGGAGGTPQPFGGSAENQGGEYEVQSAAKQRRNSTDDTANVSIIPAAESSGFAIDDDVPITPTKSNVTIDVSAPMELATPPKDKEEASEQPRDASGRFLSKSDTQMASVVGNAVEQRDSWMEKPSDSMEHSEAAALYNSEVSDEIKLEELEAQIAAQEAKIRAMTEALKRRKKR